MRFGLIFGGYRIFCLISGIIGIVDRDCSLTVHDDMKSHTHRINSRVGIRKERVCVCSKRKAVLYFAIKYEIK